jgi:VanZ family protein
LPVESSGQLIGKNLVFIRWPITLLWTAFTVFLALAPSDDTSFVTRLSQASGGTEITDAVGHVMLFGLLTVLWYLPLARRYNHRRVLLWSIVLALTIGIVTELTQSFVPDRGTSVLDLAANSVGVALAAIWIGRWAGRKAEP